MGARPQCPDCGRQLAHWNDPRHICAAGLGGRYAPAPRRAKTCYDPDYVPKRLRGKKGETDGTV